MSVFRIVVEHYDKELSYVRDSMGYIKDVAGNQVGIALRTGVRIRNWL